MGKKGGRIISPPSKRGFQSVRGQETDVWVDRVLET